MSGLAVSKFMILTSNTYKVYEGQKKKVQKALTGSSNQSWFLNRARNTCEIILKRLKVVGFIQKQGYKVPYEIKSIDVENDIGTLYKDIDFAINFHRRR